jgi:hypothetical protein
MLRLKTLGELKKNPMTSSGTETVTFRLGQSASTNYATACPPNKIRQYGFLLK